MAQKARNIIQAEFYLAGFDTSSLDETLTAISEYSNDGERSKLVVRFLDGLRQPVSKLIRKFEQLKQEEDKDLQKLPTLRGSAIRRLGKRCQRRAGRLIDIRLTYLHATKRALRAAIKENSAVAIETQGFTFRLLEPCESHETLEKAMRGQSLDIFVFGPNPDLTADGIEILYSTHFLK